MRCEEKFFEIYKKEPENVVFCPYRVCPIGAHSDHQHGKITGLAIDRGIHIAYRPKKNGVIELKSLQFDKRAQWHIFAVPPIKDGDWADYLRGATLMLEERYPLSVGLTGVIDGDLPIGGLSSSAAVTIAFLYALCYVNGLHLMPSELIHIALDAENKYVGVSCGLMDQCCVVYSRKDNLLYLDTEDESYELIPQTDKMEPYKIAIFFSGLEHNLSSSKFNMRVDECRSAAYALKAFAGMEYGRYRETHLREVPYEVFLEYKDRLPKNWEKRAEHWYSEYDRVQRGAEAWRSGDIETYGRLCFESGYSSIYNYDTGSNELKKLYEILLDTEGVYGGRFSGAGFKGCCMALINPAYEESILDKVEREYKISFPQLADKYRAYLCETTDGVGAI